MDGEGCRRREELAAVIALVLQAVGEQVPVEALLVLEALAAEPAQEGLAVVMSLDVLSQLATFLERQAVVR